MKTIYTVRLLFMEPVRCQFLRKYLRNIKIANCYDFWLDLYGKCSEYKLVIVIMWLFHLICVMP